MSVIRKWRIFLIVRCTPCICFIITSSRPWFMRKKRGFLFIYHYSTSAPTSHRANKRRHRFHTQVPCCLSLHHIMCQLCLSLPNSCAFNANELWSVYKSLNYLIHPIWIMQASAYNRVSARCMHYATWLLHIAQGSVDWCVFQDGTH